MTKETIPVFYTIDERYAPLAAVSIASLVENASPEYNYDIQIIHEGLSEETQKMLSLVAKTDKKQVNVNFVSMTEELAFLTDKPNTRLNADYFTLTIYFRIFIPEMFPQYDKGIYIDSDTVVSGDIAELFDISLDNNELVGACRDISIYGNEDLLNYVEISDGVPRDEYFNSGVLLLNMAEMRKIGFAEHFLYLLKKYDFDVVAPDQDYLNAMCYGRVKLISNEWDAMFAENEEPYAEPKLVHYNHFLKPWHYDDVQYAEYFWKYAKGSPFLEKIKQERENFDGQDADLTNFGDLVAHAVAACEKPVRFKTVFESGQEPRAGRNA